MATFNLKFHPSVIPEYPGNLIYRFRHKNLTRDIPTQIYLYPSEWNHEDSTIGEAGSPERKIILGMVRDKVAADFRYFDEIVHCLISTGKKFTVHDIVETFLGGKPSADLFPYMEKLVNMMRTKGRVGTATAYDSCLKSFRSFLGISRLPLLQLDADLMERYEGWLCNRGVVPNSRSFYMRILRAVYNRAVKDGLVEQTYPFRYVYTGVDKTNKRALPVNCIKRLRKLNIAGKPELQFARDIFLLSFYLHGMSLIDLAYLQKDSIRDGYLCYRRHKTGQLLAIKWIPEMQAIADRYKDRKRKYLLPIITDDNNSRAAYRKMYFKINRNLKKLAKLMKLDVPLTSYVARHSWASVAFNSGIPMTVISAGLGHETEKTTRIYLSELDTTELDKANDRIISSIY